MHILGYPLWYTAPWPVRLYPDNNIYSRCSNVIFPAPWSVHLCPDNNTFSRCSNVIYPAPWSVRLCPDNNTYSRFSVVTFPAPWSICLCPHNNTYSRCSNVIFLAPWSVHIYIVCSRCSDVLPCGALFCPFLPRQYVNDNCFRFFVVIYPVPPGLICPSLPGYGMTTRTRPLSRTVAMKTTLRTSTTTTRYRMSQ